MQMNSQKNHHSLSLQKQRGDLLIESLIGMVLMAIIGMGVVFVTSKMSVSQKDMRLQEIVVNQLRAYLINNGTGTIDLCTVKPVINVPGIQIAQDKILVHGCGTFVTASVNGASVANVPSPLVISVEDAALGGKIVVGGSGS